MLINLSNHPLNTWSKYQINCAEKNYGSIIDIKFPQIDTNADSEYINIIADKYLKKCVGMLNESGDKNNAIHLMGELTFCFALANKLITKRISVIASTTKRNSKDLKEGKLTKFEFVKFRQYNNKAIQK